MEVDGDATLEEAKEFGMFFSLYIVSAVLPRPEPANNAFNVMMAEANMPKYPKEVAPRNLKAHVYNGIIGKLKAVGAAFSGSSLACGTKFVHVLCNCLWPVRSSEFV